MNKASAQSHDPEAAAVKRLLEVLFESNLALKSLYLLNNRYSRSEDSDVAEKLAQLLMRLIVQNFEGINTPVVVPEPIIEFLTGCCGSRANVIEATLKATFFRDPLHNTAISWQDFYYLGLLPGKKLAHLTSSYDKLIMSKVCRQKLACAKIDVAISDRSDVSVDSFPLITDHLNTASLSCLSSVGERNHLAPKRRVAVTLCGFHRAMMGLGEDARRLFDLLTALGFRVELLDCAPANLERDPAADFYEMFETRHATAEVVIMCMPLFEMAKLLPTISPEFFKSRYVIGYWPWELTALPPGWQPIIELVDEVWASSQFLLHVFRSQCNKPVHYMPLCVEVGLRRDPSTFFGKCSNEPVSFISVFDFNSTISRKNPAGSIRAFKKAFPPSERAATLTLKSLHGNMNRGLVEAILQEIGDDKRIQLIDGPIGKEALYEMIASFTAFLSLHRSEGFGRLLVEAMLLGVPVIATDWSGSRDFIRPEHAFPIRFRRRAVGDDEYPYAAGDWAEPDLDDAAAKMRYVAANASVRVSASAVAMKFAAAAFSRDRISLLLDERMISIEKKIRRQWAD